jgi:hypothetical protein
LTAHASVQTVNLDITGAISMMNILKAIHERQDTHTIEQMLSNTLKLEPYKVSAERFGAADQSMPVTLTEYRNFILSLSGDSVAIQHNRRLEFLKPYYLEAVDHPEKYGKLIKKVSSLSGKDMDRMLETALAWLPPGTPINATILISFDIGGAAWAYRAKNGKDYIMYSVPFLLDENDRFKKEPFLQTIAHEIHHIGIPLDGFFKKIHYDELPDTNRLKLYTDLVASMIKEGMAQKFCSNAPGKFSGKPYPLKGYSAIEKGKMNWHYFISDFGTIQDSAETIMTDIVNGDCVDPGRFYERFSNYWTWKAGVIEGRDLVLGRRYYYGSEVLGVINKAFGKEALFEVMADFRKLPDYYNRSLNKLKPKHYQDYLFHDDLVMKILKLK